MTKKEKNRINKIIEVAINEFLSKGYEKTSMERIALEAELSKGGLYHYFNSKIDILFAVNMKIIEPIQYIMEKIEKNISVIDGLKQFIVDYLEYWNNHKQELTLYLLTMNISLNNQEIMKFYQVFAQNIFEYLETCFIKGQEQGIFKTRDARSHAIAFISCLDGYLGYFLIDPSIQQDKIIVEIQNTFIDDLLN